MLAPPGCAPDPTHAAGDSVLCRSVQRRHPGPAPRAAARHSPLRRAAAPRPGPCPDLAAVGPHAAAPPPPGQPPNPRASAPTQPGFRAQRVRAAPGPQRPACACEPPHPRRWPGSACAPDGVRPGPPRPAPAALAQPPCVPATARPGMALCPPRPGPKGLCPQGGDQIPKSGALETAAPSRVNFREIRDPGFWLQKQKSAGFEGAWKPR